MKGPAQLLAKQLKLLPLLLAAVSVLQVQAPSMGALGNSLSDAYLNREFRWIMFLDCHDVQHYLNYTGSKLNQLSRVKVTLRTPPAAAKPFHELWYHRGLPIGARRFGDAKLPYGQTTGAIVVRPTAGGNPAYADAITDAIVRLVLELYVNQQTPNVVLVPEEDYDRIVGALGRYNFVADLDPDTMEGAHMKIQFHSYPYDRERDRAYYYRH